MFHPQTNLRLVSCMGVSGTDYSGSVVFLVSFLIMYDTCTYNTSFTPRHDAVYHDSGDHPLPVWLEPLTSRPCLYPEPGYK